MTDKYIALEGVNKSYGKGAAQQQVLQQINLNVARGEQVAVLGHSGCGKSTLLNVISGIDAVDTGAVYINDKNLTDLSEKERTLFRRQHIGFVYQSFNLIPTLSALENIQLPLQLNRYPASEIHTRSHALLEQVGLAERAEAFPDELSGGEQQRVAIARAMVHSPSLVLADEHTGNLDANTGRQMMELFNDIARSNNQTVLMVTHSMAVAKTADRVIRFTDGKLTADDKLDESALAW